MSIPGHLRSRLELIRSDSATSVRERLTQGNLTTSYPCNHMRSFFSSHHTHQQDLPQGDLGSGPHWNQTQRRQRRLQQEIAWTDSCTLYSILCTLGTGIQYCQWCATTVRPDFYMLLFFLISRSVSNITTLVRCCLCARSSQVQGIEQVRACVSVFGADGSPRTQARLPYHSN